jgi:3-deoxy-7-phosphoheptulonate synthase
MKQKTDDIRIDSMHEVTPPIELHKKYPLTETASETVYQARKTCHDIIHGDDDRLIIVVGPCSIHDVDAAKEYAGRLQALRDELKDDLHIIMRVYFEKPRTSVGWKGLINDPDLNDSFNIDKGLEIARELLLDLADSGMPAATEYLDLISPQYIADLVSWAAIGARTTESQGHRELASGVSCPIGFKNGTYGNLNVAINAVSAAYRPHSFLSVTKEGHSAIFKTTGNEDCHVILRGGQNEANYSAEHVEKAIAEINAASEEDCPIQPRLMVDCSHANSEKDYRKQPNVAANIAEQLAAGSPHICGVMIESHLVAGNQKAEGKTREELTYGQSITDACINWDTTDQVLRDLAAAVRARREKNKG